MSIDVIIWIGQKASYALRFRGVDVLMHLMTTVMTLDRLFKALDEGGLLAMVMFVLVADRNYVMSCWKHSKSQFWHKLVCVSSKEQGTTSLMVDLVTLEIGIANSIL